MEKYKEMNYAEQMEITEILWSWLKDYTDEVINFILTEKIDEILNSDSSMHLLRELHERQQKETKDHISSLRFGIEYGNKFERLDVLYHSKSYRDILWDLYIKDWRKDE